jgi:transcription elongation factor GreA
MPGSDGPPVPGYRPGLRGRSLRCYNAGFPGLDTTEESMKERLTARLKKELAELDHELKIELPKAIKFAAALGDLRENAEYQSALERQSLVKLRVARIRKKLGELSLMKIDQVPTDRIGLGSEVLLLDDESGNEVRYELVLPDDGDVPAGRISIASPIGKGLMGHKPGDEVTIRTPRGARVYEVLEMKTLHEREKGEKE